MLDQFADTARGIVIKENSVLLIYRKKNGKTYYSIPGGKQEAGEDLEKTAVREVMEETSINVLVKKFLGKFYSEKFKKDDYLYLCEYISGIPALAPNSEELFTMQSDNTNIYIPMWIPISDVSNKNIKPKGMEKYFKKYLTTY